MSILLEIEQKTLDYAVANYGKAPRFVLMDDATYTAYNKFFYSKERLILKGTADSPELINTVNGCPANLKRVFLENATLEILNVKSDKPIFEVVG